MPAPFYNLIRGATAGAAGTGNFTPSGVPTGGGWVKPWSSVPAGWVGLVLYEDPALGTDVGELSWSYWNGTTLSRGANQLYDSSSGSLLSLTATATASMVAEASEVMSHLGTTPWAGTFAAASQSAGVTVGTGNGDYGTAAPVAVAATNYLTRQKRLQRTSATTAGASAGINHSAAAFYCSSTAGMGGAEFIARFGASALPTGPRLRVGLVSLTWSSVGGGDPSPLTSSHAFFGKDSADTNIQLMTNNNTAGGANKIDTGMPWVANAWYEAAVWMEPGSLTVNGLLVRLDTGAIWFQRTTTKAPVTDTALLGECAGSLGTVTGTAMVFHVGSMMVRGGF